MPEYQYYCDKCDTNFQIWAEMKDHKNYKKCPYCKKLRCPQKLDASNLPNIQVNNSGAKSYKKFISWDKKSDDEE